MYRKTSSKPETEKRHLSQWAHPLLHQVILKTRSCFRKRFLFPGKDKTSQRLVNENLVVSREQIKKQFDKSSSPVPFSLKDTVMLWKPYKGLFLVVFSPSGCCEKGCWECGGGGYVGDGVCWSSEWESVGSVEAQEEPGLEVHPQTKITPTFLMVDHSCIDWNGRNKVVPGNCRYIHNRRRRLMIDAHPEKPNEV